MTSAPRIAVIGAAGRMGRRIIAAAIADGCLIASAIERAEASELGQDAAALAGLPPGGTVLRSDLDRALEGVDAAIDFTHPSATARNVEACRKAHVPLVLGTTGVEGAAKAAIEKASKEIPIVHAANFSIGVNVLLAVVTNLARTLHGYDAEVVEIHHRKKVDAPSGTALRLAEAVAEGHGVDLKKVGGTGGDEASDASRVLGGPHRPPPDQMVTGRNGQVGARTDAEIGVLAVRGGDVVGDHTVYFLGPGERVEVTHRAHSRDTFAAGAVRAARWVTGRAPGLYDMRAVLGL